MLLLAAATLAAAAPDSAQRTATGATVQAQATIRIISGVRLSFGEERNQDAPPARATILRTEGSVQPARLIEFE